MSSTPARVHPKTARDDGVGHSGLKTDEQGPEPLMCVHGVIEKRARGQPEAAAVRAWDGHLSYAELDARSSALAAHLARHGVRPETYVPILSEKSLWVPVAVLAVLKAGGAFVLLEASHPSSRLEEICRAVGATIIVSSRDLADKAARLGPKVVVGADTCEHGLDDSTQEAAPGNVAYAVFTSGTTGKPKGVAIEHRAFCNSAIAHAKALDMDASSRVLQFASHAFDACITEMVTALMVGACVCIPSEQGRKLHIGAQIRQLQVNWALLTPTMSRILDVSDLDGLETLVLGGEAVRADDLAKWTPHVKLFLAYGLTECAVVNLVQPCRQGDLDSTNLGHGVGVSCFIVEPDNHSCLARRGVVGELLLEGPSVGRGYINGDVQTAQAFVDNAPWYSGTSRL